MIKSLNMSKTLEERFAEQLSKEIDKHIITTFLSIGDVSTVKDSGITIMIERCKMSFDINKDSNKENAAMALKNLTILMIRKIKRDHCG